MEPLESLLMARAIWRIHTSGPLCDPCLMRMVSNTSGVVHLDCRHKLEIDSNTLLMDTVEAAH